MDRQLFKKKQTVFSQEDAILLTVLIVMFSAAEYNRFHIYMAGYSVHIKYWTEVLPRDLWRGGAAGPGASWLY